MTSLSVIFSTKSFAQDSGENNLKNFRFGLKAQPSVVWFKPEDTKKYESSGARFKFAYGLMTEFRLNKVASFLTGLEINYMGGGTNYKDSTHYLPPDDTNNFYVNKRKYDITYVDIPITLKMKTPEIGYITYFGQFGVNASVRAKAKAKDEGSFKNNSTATSLDNVDITKDISLFALGLNVGAGLEFNLAGSTSVFTSVNYHNGFTNVLKKESVSLKDKKDAFIKQDTKSNYISLSVGILF